MNLALLDPFRRQIPDRIDSTLSLPRPFHPRRSKGSNNIQTVTYHTSVNPLQIHSDSAKNHDANNKLMGATSSTGRILRSKVRDHSNQSGKNNNNDDEDVFHDDNNDKDEKDEEELTEPYDNSCFTVSFNRRGTYLAAGHLSGAMAVHDFSSRTLSSIVHPPSQMEQVDGKEQSKGGKEEKSEKRCTNDVKQKSDKNGHSDDDNDVDDDMDDEENQYLNNPHIIRTTVIDSTAATKTQKVKKPSMSSSSSTSSASSSSSAHGPHASSNDKDNDISSCAQNNSNNRLFPNGITSITWSRQSRTCLIASSGDNHVCLIDNSHPYGPDDVSLKMIKDVTIATTSTAATISTGNGAMNRNNEKNTHTSPIPQRMSSPGIVMNDTNNKDDTNGSGVENYSSTVSLDIDDETIDHLKNTNSNKSKKEKPNQNDDNDGFSDDISDENNQPEFKRTRYIPQVEIIDKNDIILDPASDAKNSSRVSTSDPNYTLMTSLERGIAMKPSSDRSMQERHVHALMKMRLEDISKKKKKKKKKTKRSNTSGNNSSDSNVISSSETSNTRDDPSSQAKKIKSSQLTTTQLSEYYRYQKVVIPLPTAIQNSVQIHPNGLGGLACLDDGSLVIFGLSPLNIFCVKKTKEHDKSTPSACYDKKGKLFYLIKSSPDEGKDLNNDQNGYFVTCATFDHRGHFVYAGTKCGTLLGFQLSSFLQREMFDKVLSLEKRFLAEDVVDEGPLLISQISGGAVVNQVVCSRNGNMILINSRDNILRLYEKKSMQDYTKLNRKKPTQIKSLEPKFSFQDVVSHCKWASCDFSGDGEFIVGGCNNVEAGDKYELYLWNTATGNLLDQLTGPQISLYSLSWHPTRSFIAVGTSDGLVDIWGPRMDWTAFAPDFQALQKNVEYVEKEDEFDVVIDDVDEMEKRKELSDKIEERELVDVTTIDPIPAFDSDSECEGNIFYFTTKIRPNFTGK